jgi:hypothetical protein
MPVGVLPVKEYVFRHIFVIPFVVVVVVCHGDLSFLT